MSTANRGSLAPQGLAAPGWRPCSHQLLGPGSPQPRLSGDTAKAGQLAGALPWPPPPHCKLPLSSRTKSKKLTGMDAKPYPVLNGERYSIFRTSQRVSKEK